MTFEGHCQTSLQVRRALEHDDGPSWAWVVSHLSPLLELQARYRLRRARLGHLDPRDVLNDVWLRSYPKLDRLRERDGRITPVLVRFLAQTLLLRINELLRESIRGSRRCPLPGGRSSGNACPEPLQGRETSADRRLLRAELQEEVRAALAQLGELDQELLILRGMEQLPVREIARRLGVAPGAVSMRYRRALERLRRRLPASLLGGLCD